MSDSLRGMEPARPTMRAVGLFAAVLHHGLANLSQREDSVPSSWGKVIETSNKFVMYLSGNDHPPK